MPSLSWRDLTFLFLSAFGGVLTGSACAAGIFCIFRTRASEKREKECARDFECSDSDDGLLDNSEDSEASLGAFDLFPGFPPPSPTKEVWLRDRCEKIMTLPEYLNPPYCHGFGISFVVERDEKEEPFYPNVTERIFWIRQVVRDEKGKRSRTVSFWRISSVLKVVRPLMVLVVDVSLPFNIDSIHTRVHRNSLLVLLAHYSGVHWDPDFMIFSKKTGRLQNRVTLKMPDYPALDRNYFHFYPWGENYCFLAFIETLETTSTEQLCCSDFDFFFTVIQYEIRQNHAEIVSNVKEKIAGSATICKLDFLDSFAAKLNINADPWDRGTDAVQYFLYDCKTRQLTSKQDYTEILKEKYMDWDETDLDIARMNDTKDGEKLGFDQLSRPLSYSSKVTDLKTGKQSPQEIWFISQESAEDKKYHFYRFHKHQMSESVESLIGATSPVENLTMTEEEMKEAKIPQKLIDVVLEHRSWDEHSPVIYEV
ncbi:MAG: hypothetical protein GY696_03505 [Gammaproteobacteria bacterium]|nr:hypothetical protein [Gammaproteobacteria bacterium]